ncbi:Aa-trans domain-containing protein [Aphelenchoides bicaudatus]|nr:Aa-trans domain-containing protein [Aphelenchoides bicaudatus]
MPSTDKVAPIPDKLHVQIDPAPETTSPPSTKDYKSCSVSSLGSIETSAVSSSSVETTTDVNYRPNGLSAFATLINFLKGMIGPGCLSLPLALKQAGLWTALVLIFIFGFLNNYCMLQLVRSSQKLSRNKGQVLDYGGVAYEACANSFKSLRKYRNVFKFLANTVIIFLQIGICAVYYVFISTHIKEIVEDNSDFRASTTTWSLLIFLPMAVVNLLRNLKTIAYLSMFGNVAMIGSLIFIMQFLLRQPHMISQLPGVTNFDGILMACGSILYSFEGQAMVLPMENRLKHPKKMVGPFGVLSQGMSLVTVVYAACGFFGYITYGNKVQGSITLNLPSTTMMYVVKGLLIFVIYTGFVIQQYVIVDLAWASLKDRLKLDTSRSRVLDFAAEGVFRTLLVIFELLLAILVPKLESIIPLVGATAGMLLAFVFPTLIDTMTFGPKWLSEGRPGKFNWKLIWCCSRNTLLLILGVFGLIAGLQSNVRNLLQEHA